MAITTTTITKAAGWARTDVIDMLEQGFTWLGLHGSRISGLVTSISAYSGGGTVGSSGTTYYDVPSISTSGIGTGATFDVVRSSGNVSAVYVNRPGKDYTQGEILTISPENIGGGSAVAINVTVNVDGGATPVGYGSTNQFFDKNLTPSDTNRPWGVLKQDFDTSKRFGVTYRGFKVYDDYRLSFYAGSSFFPFNTTNTSNQGGQYRDTFRGTKFLDISGNVSNSSYNSLDSNHDGSSTQVSAVHDNFQYATINSPTTHDLKLNIYRSSIDPNFAVLSFNQPSISGTLDQSTFSTFIIHNFNSNLWNLNEVFSAGITFIDKGPSINADSTNSLPSSTNYATIAFKTALIASKHGNDSNTSLATRSAEAGWAQIYNQDSPRGTSFKNFYITPSQTNYTTSIGSGLIGYQTVNTFSSATVYSRTGGIKDRGVIAENSTIYGNQYPITTYKSVIRGIPINGNLIPCPYYMPDDFVIIDFKVNQSGQDFKQGDTVTISGSEVYTVITGSYNKAVETAGVLFCARTV